MDIVVMMTDTILLVDIVVGLMIGFGLFVCWVISRKVSRRRYNYLLAYALYVFLVNVPRLGLTYLKVDVHNPEQLFLDIFAITTLLWAAEGWSLKEMPAWHLGIWVAGVFFAFLHHGLGLQFGALAAAMVRVFTMLLAVYYVSRFAPLPIAIGFSSSILTWIVLAFTFLHAGDPVGHLWGMAVKFFVFGMILLTHYERQHRELYGVARTRKAIIEAVASWETMGDAENNTGRFGFRRCAKLDAANG